MEPKYQVMTMDVGCCSGALPTNKIAVLCNKMDEQGYTLDKIFVDIRPQCGPFCPKRCAIMVFSRT